MRFNVKVEELERRLHLVQGIVDKRSPRPILSHVLLTAQPGGDVTLTATDLEVGVTASVPADVALAGTATVPAHPLHDIVRHLPKKELTITLLERNRVEVTCGSIQYKLPGMDPAEYPAVPKFEDLSTLPLPANLLRDMLRKTEFAVSTDETRYNLNGIYLESTDEGTLRCVATDGHRLAIMEGGQDLPRDPGPRQGVILPRKGVAEVRRILDMTGDTEVVRLGFKENSAILLKEGVSLVMRLVDGQFPDYRQVVPDESERVLKVKRTAALEALKRVSVIAADQGYATKLQFEHGALEISTASVEGGEARERVEAEYAQDGFSVGFNARYMMDVLQVIDAEVVALGFADDISPAVVRPVVADDSPEKSYRCVVMPMRI